MIASRRDLLKFFGVGTAIVPLIGGVPKTEAPAELIAVPEIQPLILPEQLDVGWKDIHAFETAVLGNGGMAEIEVHIRTRDKRVWHFRANTFVSKTSTQVMDVTSFDDVRGPWRKQLAGLPEIRWTMEGVCTGSNTIEAWEGRR